MLPKSQPGQPKPLSTQLNCCEYQCRRTHQGRIVKNRRVGEKWCPGTESNRRHADFQSAALPTELPGHIAGRTCVLEGAPIIILGRCCPALNPVHHHRRARARDSFRPASLTNPGLCTRVSKRGDALQPRVCGIRGRARALHQAGETWTCP